MKPGRGCFAAAMQENASQCQHCGAATQTQQGLCVSCLLKEGLEGDAEASAEIFERRLAEDEIPDKPRRLGNYEILRELGRGGMGAVYLARRADAQYEKHVAIKLIKRGMDTDSVLRHFCDERQILAGFDHPNIARLFDAGTTSDGLPYFVMEYIEGLPINEYCDQKRLSVAERLKLFREVCAAVSYAHRHLVVHRDIKRSNILVTPEGIPKLLDFGIAKMLQEGATADARVTLTGMLLMTPEYASPEQLRGEAVTTTTDVYSLGVVLYELLTGQSPYHFAIHSRNYLERAISEQEPTRPSTAVTSRCLGQSMSDSRLLRGDLDNIVLMALRKESERRYQSVDQFSDDIRRYLGARPVLARKDTLRYRAAKFVQRNAVATATAVLLFLSLVVGIIATTWEANKAHAQEAIAKAQKSRAERRFNDVRQLAHSVLFDYHDAIKDLPGATRVRERLVKDALTYLDSLATEAQGDLALQRELAGAYERVADVRGQQYVGGNLGDRAGALDSYGKALRIREILLARAPHDVENLRGLVAINKKIGDALQETRNADRGLEHLQTAVVIATKLAVEQPADLAVRGDLANAYNSLGLALEDRNEMSDALENHRKALAIWQGLVGADSKNPIYRRGLSVSYENMGRIQALSGAVKEALETNQKAMALRQALFDEDSSNADYRRILSISYQNTGDYLGLLKDNAAAVENFRKKLALDEQSYAADPANAQARGDLAYSYERLGELLGDLGDYAAACPYDLRAIELTEQNIAADPQDLTIPLVAATARARLAEAQGKTGSGMNARKQCEQAARLIETTPDDSGNSNQRSLRSHAYTELADAYMALAESKQASDTDRAAARKFYQLALNIMHDGQSHGLLSQADHVEMRDVLAKLAKCDQHLRR